jgi:hypothetical protein
LANNNIKQTKSFKNKQIVLIAFILCLLLFLISCSSNENSSTFSTWTISPSASATCPHDIQLTTPEGWGATTRLIIILFDPTSISDQSLVMINGDRINDISTFISRIIPEIMYPGDQLSIFELGTSLHYSEARVARLFSDVTLPQLFSAPSPAVTFTPYPTFTLATAGYERILQNNLIHSLNTSIAMTETANADLYSCQAAAWNGNLEATSTAWETISNGEEERICNDAENLILEENDNRGATDELFYGGVYYGLSFATIDLLSDCDNYSECILIIIDDLHTWNRSEPDDLETNINLSGINSIYAIMPDCSDVNQPDCSDLQTFWTNEFHRFGANIDEIFFFNGRRAESDLLLEMRR